MKLLTIIGIPLWYSLFTMYSGHCSDLQVQGYYNSNGTYTSPYIRTSPDSYRDNNRGYQPSGNIHYNTYDNSGQLHNSLDTDLSNDR